MNTINVPYYESCSTSISKLKENIEQLQDRLLRINKINLEDVLDVMATTIDILSNIESRINSLENP